MKINEIFKEYFKNDIFVLLEKLKIENADRLNETISRNNNAYNNFIKTEQNKEYNFKKKYNGICFKFLNDSELHFNKNIKESIKKIYEEPIPNYDGYLARGNLIDLFKF